MKKFFTVLQFELNNYFKNKSYMISTILIAVVVGFLLFLPSIFDMSSILGLEKENSKTEIESEIQEIEETEKSDKVMAIYDKDGIMGDLSELKVMFPTVSWLVMDDNESVKEVVKNNDAVAGFVVKSYGEYDYYIYNKGLGDSTKASFDMIMNSINQQNYCKINGINYEEVSNVFNSYVISNEEVLGKDMTSNYWYCYILVILIFMIIILYGVMIATSVTSEKSNRSIEVLVTSTSPNSLLFGKVIAGAIASVVQVGVVLGTAVLSYKINQKSWGNQLDMLLDIPADVLITFAFFGIGGFIFYAFIYGAVGALVSKTEDINKSAGGIQMIIMIVYFAVLTQLQNIDGIVMKVASFLPISSYSAMFSRVAMGTVAPWEIVLSFAILVASIIGMGIFGAKIYRMGTLRYGNPIKILQVIKTLRNK